MAEGSGPRSRWSAWRSLPAELAAQTRSALGRGATAVFDSSPRPVQRTWRLIEYTGRGAVEDRVPGLAAEAALFTLISLPALLLAVIGSLAFTAAALGPGGSDQLRRLVLGVPESFLSDPTYATYQQAVEAVLVQTRGGVVSLSILLAVWTGSRAVNRYLETITIAYGVDRRPGWRQRLLALGLTIAGLLGAVAVLPPLVVGPRLLHWLTPDEVADTTLRTLGLLFWPAIVLLILGGLATLYHFGVPWQTPWRRDLPGALLAVAMWLMASAGLRAYLTLSVQSDGIYRQLAVPIAVVLWLYITAFAVLLGAEFNAAIERLWPHESHPWQLRRIRRRTSAAGDEIEQ